MQKNHSNPADLSHRAFGSVAIENVRAHAYTVPTSRQPESDGTLAWKATSIILVEVDAGGKTGIGYTYYHPCAASFIQARLAEIMGGKNALQVRRRWKDMLDLTRNLGRAGMVASAISAVDVALWDLKARLLDMPLATLLDTCLERIPIYGSGGFCSYRDAEFRAQFQGWIEVDGITALKMKVGQDPADDPRRVALAREIIGDDVALFVDANGAFGAKDALRMAEIFADFGVTWFEEPVSSDDLGGLARVREQGPAGMEIAAGEYGYDPWYFQKMLAAGAVDVLQADATRCMGITGFLQAGTVALSHHLEFSAHTAPTLHANILGALPNARHLEYFWDHTRIEDLFFDGIPRPKNGELCPNFERPGLGIDVKYADIEPYAL